LEKRRAISFTVVKNNKRRRKGLRGLLNSPHRKGVCRRVFLTTPRKPNSAKRKVAKIYLTSRMHRHCYIAGIGHTLQKYGHVLIRGGRTRDLPGVFYQIIRGKHDCKEVYHRFNARSKYGIKKIPDFKQVKKPEKKKKKKRKL